MFDESTPRRTQIATRVTEEEHAFITSVADGAGMTVGRLIRQALAAETARLAAKRIASAIERELEHAAVSP
jgi:hypothetical protein